MVSQPPEVAVVDFHHARGPEVEFWISPEGEILNARNDWSLMPFMALSDGAHASTEDFSYFTLLRKGEMEGVRSTSLFGIACARQINANRLKNRSPDVTRSTVQKAVVVLTMEPGGFGQLRERLSAVTNAWFAQEDFSNIDILKKFQESLVKAAVDPRDDGDQSFGLSLREMIHEFKHQTLVLFKCLLLQRKMLFFGSRCERLCMMQYALISLIPGLLRNLEDCADPALDSYAQIVMKATSLKTSDRNSLLAYMGLPIQIFGKGSIFGPYTPLQQLDILASYDTKSYVVGSTNSLLLQQKDKYSDLLVNLDDPVPGVTINSPSLRTALALSPADRRWIDFLTQTVNDTWDQDHPSRPNTFGYAGSEEFIRFQFEEYLLALLSCTAYHIDQESSSTTQLASNSTTSNIPDADPNPTTDFSPDFIALWQSTPNYALWSHLTANASIYSIAEPRHPTAGGLSVEDVQRRLAQQVAELHLDERVREGRETLNKTLAVGREKFGKLWAEVEARRLRRGGSGSRSRSRRRGVDESAASSLDIPRTAESDAAVAAQGGKEHAPPQPLSPTHSNTTTASAATTTATTTKWTSLRERAAKIQLAKPAVDTAQMQAAARDNAAKAGAYLSSWGTWAKERGREWQQQQQQSSPEAGAANNSSAATREEELAPAPPSGLRGGEHGDVK